MPQTKIFHRRTNDFRQARAWLRAARALGLTAQVIAVGEWRDSEGTTLFAGRRTTCQIAARGNALIYAAEDGPSRVEPMLGAEICIEFSERGR